MKKIKVKQVLGPVLIIVILFIIGIIFCPTFIQVKKDSIGSDHVLLAENGEVIQTLRTDFSKRRLAWFSLSQFSDSLKESVIKAEDHRFYSHIGIDPIGLARAFWVYFHGQKIQGASTISMQLTDLIQPEVLKNNQRIQKGSILHKVLQVWRAIVLEAKWSKSEILEAYLNLIHLRGEMQGVPAFSYGFLSKHPLALDKDESIIIASSISSPNLKIKFMEDRACRLLQRIKVGETISCESIKSIASELFQKRPEIPRGPQWAPHLAQRLFSENKNQNIIQSQLNKDLQIKVAQVLEKNIQRLKNDKVRDSAAIVIENKTGKVIAYVGAVASSPSPHVDGIRAYRQAGSALKPFLYSKALETKTLTAASILLDEPTVLSWSGQVYRPLNYDKHFNGPVSVREALASSLNVPAVKIVTIIGLHQTYRVLQDIGLTNLKEPDFYGVSMALGAVEVRLEDLTNAYRIFANGGLLSPLNFVDNTVDKPSSLLEQKRVRIFSPGASYIIGSILSDQNARSTGFGWESPLETPFWTAVKTGTSKDYRDNWCVGFSELYTVGVWTGNFDATPMEKVSGVTGAGPAWYDIMNELHRNKKSAAPNPPEEIVVRKIQHSWASQSTNEFFINGTEPNEEKVVLAEDKQIQFVFPAEGSVLTKDPHLDPSLIALSMRFKGMVPAHAKIYWDGKLLGEAISPFVVEHPPTGSHSVEIRGDDQRVLAKVHFEVRGAKEF